MVKKAPVNPPGSGRPSGYANGFRAGDLLFVAGQIGGDPTPEGRHRLVSSEFVPQFEKALANVVDVVKAASGKATDLVEMTIYVKDIDAYRRTRKAIGPVWRRLLGTHYPAMTLVEVSDFFEEGALVEIKAVAALG